MAETLLLTGEQMSEVDARTIDLLGLSSMTLMESAAWACVEALVQGAPRALSAGVVCVCGTGNNGGDGIAIARRLHGLGYSVEIALVGRHDQLSHEAGIQWAIADRLGLAMREADSAEGVSFLSRSWASRGVVVDALFGTGLARPLQGAPRSAVEAMAEAQKAGVYVLSVDLPSGVDAGTGLLHGDSVHADRTVTFATPKLGHFLQPGRSRCGELVCADIGIPHRHWVDLVADAARLAGPEDLLEALPPASAEAHKGTFGHLLVVAGSPGKTGAARLCVDAALRSGVGLVTLVLPESLDVPELVPEAMVVRIPDLSWGAEAILNLLEERDALAIGPGLGTTPETIFLARQLYAEADVPAVFDADAINALVAATPDQLKPAGARVITPHPGEFARLSSAAWRDIEPRKISAAQDVARVHSATLLLKGSSTLVVDPSGTFTVNPTGNPGMGTAGSGDVLTGVVGALLTRGVQASLAARAAAYWHGLAGDAAASSLGQPSLVAGDIVDHLGVAWKLVVEDEVAPVMLRSPEDFLR